MITRRSWRNADYSGTCPALHYDVRGKRIVDYRGIPEGMLQIVYNSRTWKTVSYRYDSSWFPQVNSYRPGVYMNWAPPDTVGSKYFCETYNPNRSHQVYHRVFKVEDDIYNEKTKIIWVNPNDLRPYENVDEKEIKKIFLFSKDGFLRRVEVLYMHPPSIKGLNLDDFLSTFWKVDRNKYEVPAMELLNWGTRVLSDKTLWVREDKHGFVLETREEFPIELGKEYRSDIQIALAVWKTSDLIGQKRADLLGKDLVDFEIYPPDDLADYAEWVVQDHLEELRVNAIKKLRPLLRFKIEEIKNQRWADAIPDDLLVTREHSLAAGNCAPGTDAFIARNELPQDGVTVGELKSRGLFNLREVGTVVKIAWLDSQGNK